MLTDKIHSDLKVAQLGRDELRVSTLRMLLSELKYAQINKGAELTDEDVMTVVRKEIKKRNDSVTLYKNGGREQLAEKEEQEIKLLEPYLPAQMPIEELTNIVDEAINEVGASSVSNMGLVIKAVMVKVAGKADGGRVSTIVKERLASKI